MRKKTPKMTVICLLCDREFQSKLYKTGKIKRPVYKTCPGCRDKNKQYQDWGTNLD